jgi:hypothetical protein
VEELSQLQRSVANAVPHPLYGVPSGELAEDGVDPVAQASQEGAPLGRGTALLGLMGVRGYREEHIQGVRGTRTGLGTSLPPGIEIGEQAVVAAGAVVRDS